jgi:hypothetical protein
VGRSSDDNALCWRTSLNSPQKETGFANKQLARKSDFAPHTTFDAPGTIEQTSGIFNLVVLTFSLDGKA